MNEPGRSPVIDISPPLGPRIATFPGDTPLTREDFGRYLRLLKWLEWNIFSAGKPATKGRYVCPAPATSSF